MDKRVSRFPEGKFVKKNVLNYFYFGTINRRMRSNFFTIFLNMKLNDNQVEKCLHFKTIHDFLELSIIFVKFKRKIQFSINQILNLNEFKS